MKFCFTLIIFFQILNLSVFSQQKIPVTKVKATNPVEVGMPLLMDSTNLKGEKFETKNLLDTYVGLPSRSEYTEELRADLSTDYFYFQKPQRNASFRFVSFQLSADRYAKATLKVASPSMFEIYINGKKEIAKTSLQDSIQTAKVAEKEFTTLPGTNDIVIKYMASAFNISPEGLKILVETDKNDSITNWQAGFNGKRSIDIEDVIGGTRINGVSISPDGRFYLIGKRVITSDGKISGFTELYDSKSDKTIYLGERLYKWMPKSARFYYFKTIGDSRQLISVNPENLSEDILLENISVNNSNSSYFLPDETAFIVSEKESNDSRSGDFKLLVSPEDRQQGYYDREFLFKYDIKTGLKQRLTFGRHSTHLNDISTDSRYLLFSIAIENLNEIPFRLNSMYKLDLQTMSVETLWENDPYAYNAKFSPDGKRIVIIGTANAFGGLGLIPDNKEMPNNYDLQAYIMELDSKKTEPITIGFDPSVNSVSWNSEGKIFLQVHEKDSETVYIYDPQRKNFTRLNLPEDIIRSFSVSGDSSYAGYMGQSASNPYRVYSFDIKNGKSVIISDPSADDLKYIELGEVKDWNFISSAGDQIHGRYYLPPGFDDAKKYPVIVYYYGGTTPTLRTFDAPYPMHVYAAQGYVVYVIQPSGAIGYGQEFSARHVNAWGKRTADEIIEGTTKFLQEHPFTDRKKVGCIGASYGGFMTMYLQTQTDIFAAAVSHAGISSISSYWGEGYWGYTYSAFASTGSYPWNNRELYVEQSPLFNADKIHTPLLLIHGMDDTNVPVGESIQMFTALKILGRPVELIQVKGENHGITNYKRRIQWNNSIFAWFAKWLKDDPAWWESIYPPQK